MRTPTGCLALCATLVLFLTASRAFAGASILEPRPVSPRQPVTSLNVGFWAASSQPAGSSADELDRSFRTGASLTWVRSRTTGLGIALDYCRWRAPAVGAELDNLFSAFSGTAIRGTEVTMSGLRGTVRGTVWPLPDALVSPWAQVGAGACRLDRKLVFPVEQLQYSGWEVHSLGTKTISYQPIVLAGLGIDVRTNASMRVGFDVMGELILLQDASEPVTAITIGGHVLFGYWSGR